MKIKNSIVATISLLLCATMFSQSPTRDKANEDFRQEHGIPKAKGTLLNKKGEIIRAAPIPVGIAKFTKDNQNLLKSKAKWMRLKEIGYNAVRVCWVDPWFKREGNGEAPIDEFVKMADIAVRMGRELKMTVIIDYHDVGEYIKSEGFGQMHQLWKKIAPRYQYNDNVIYELNNEQTWDYNQYVSDDYMKQMKKTYQMVRELAPSRQIILFSFNSLAYDCKKIVDQYDWIDWNYTTIGFHMYGAPKGNIEQEQKNFESLISNYKVICTEWDYVGAPFDNLANQPEPFEYIKEFYGSKVNSQILEAAGISWADWRGWNDATTNEYEEILVSHAKEKGYWWGK